MNDKILLYIIAFLVAMLYMRYIMVLVFLPSMYLKALSTRVSNHTLSQIFRLQHRVIQRFTGGALTGCVSSQCPHFHLVA